RLGQLFFVEIIVAVDIPLIEKLAKLTHIRARAGRVGFVLGGSRIAWLGVRQASGGQGKRQASREDSEAPPELVLHRSFSQGMKWMRYNIRWDVVKTPIA